MDECKLRWETAGKQHCLFGGRCTDFRHSDCHIRRHVEEPITLHTIGSLLEEQVKLKAQLAAANTTIEGLTLAIAEAVKVERERIKRKLRSRMAFLTSHQGKRYEIMCDDWKEFWQELEGGNQ